MPAKMNREIVLGAVPGSPEGQMVPPETPTHRGDRDRVAMPAKRPWTAQLQNRAAGMPPMFEISCRERMAECYC